jgi:2-hydroxy-3-keto-5-methylthiopentenyl-1-phosphate phosphatase
MHSLKVFCDFDGTVAASDIGDLIFKTFGDQRAQDAIELWYQGKLKGDEMYYRSCESITSVDIGILNNLIDEQTLDPAFPEFVSYCRGRNIEVIILSDGFDYYIHRVLKRYGLENIRVFANHLDISENGFIPSFPFMNPYCTRTANCKGTHVLNEAADDEIRIVIGDGYSDSCAADYADVVFAKHKLVAYCRQNNISYFDFADFSHVQARCEELLSRKRLRVRHRAELRRREAFRIEANA